jgi:hypothetical protein
VCVRLIAREIKEYAMTTPEDARRIVANYTDAERIDVMHVCGACGVRDPNLAYCRTVRLSNLPADVWLRATGAFVAKIGTLSSATLLARIDPPLPQRPGEPEPATHWQVHVPLASLFNLVEVDGE